MARTSWYGALSIPSGSRCIVVDESAGSPIQQATPALNHFRWRTYSQFNPGWIGIVLVIFLLSGCNVPAATPTPGNRPALIYPTDTPAPIIGITPSPTFHTPIPTSSPTPSPTVPVAILESDQQPLLPYDLLYLSNSRLMLWDREGKSQEALISQVSSYTLSSDGSQVALLRAKGITANGTEMYDLERMDLNTRQIQILIDDIRQINSLSLSPDLRWLAYVMPGDDQTVHIVANTNDPFRQTIAVCQSSHSTHCTDLRWSFESRELAWSDREGLWLYTLGQNTPQLILPDQASITDPRGNTTQVTVRYQSLSWSPFGRYILCEVVVPSSEVRWWGVADTTLKRLVLLPNSYTTQPPRISAIWTQDGGLFVTRPSHYLENQRAMIEFWSVVPTSSKLLLLNGTYTLAPIEIYTSRLTISVPDLSLENIYQANDYFFYLAAYTTGTPVLSALMRFDARFGFLEKTNDLIIDEQTILWAPDGTSALIGDHAAKWISIGSSQLFDLQAMIGPQSCCFSWVPSP